MSLRAVLFDWRGTLVTSLDEEAWATEALRRLGRDDDPTTLAEGLATIADLLDGPGVDSDAALHWRTYLGALAGDAESTLRELCAAGLRLAASATSTSTSARPSRRPGWTASSTSSPCPWSTASSGRTSGCSPAPCARSASNRRTR